MLCIVMLLPFSTLRFPDGVSHDEPASAAGWLGLFTERTLAERRVRASTVEAYALDLAMVSRWAAGKSKDLLQLDPADLRSYAGERLEQGIAPSTLSRHLSSCRRFYAFLVSQGVLPVNPAAGVVAPAQTRHPPRLVPDDVLGKLLRARVRQAVSPGSAYRSRRDHIIVWMLYETRLGVSDIRVLRWRQIDEQRQLIRVPVRGGTERSFVLDARLLAALKALRGAVAMAGFDRTESAYCFPTACGLPMTRQALCHVVRKRAREFGPQADVTPSALRQSGRVHRAQRRAVRPGLVAV
jgi:site-specific recombinase XerD